MGGWDEAADVQLPYVQTRAQEGAQPGYDHRAEAGCPPQGKDNAQAGRLREPA